MLLASTTAVAGNGDRSADVIASLKDVDVVEVIIVPDQLLFRSPLTEAAAREYGCVFSASAPLAVEQMLLHVKDAKLLDREAPANPVNLRTIVYLKSRQGTTALLLEDIGGNAKVGGQLISKNMFRNSYFDADANILKNITAWVKLDTVTAVKHDASCLKYGKQW